VRRLALMVVMAVVSAAPAQVPRAPVSVTFAPEKKNTALEAAAEQYRRIWADEGERMIDALEQVSTLPFPERDVKVEIYEGPSHSGRGSVPMRLRASYSPDVKKGTLVHELGHRMNAQLTKRPKDLDEHRLLFLYLYDVWEDLYGRDFADREVAFEKTLKGLYDYKKAWTWALAMTRAQRFARFSEVVRANGRWPEHGGCERAGAVSR
jgi:hypothetical protein